MPPNHVVAPNENAVPAPESCRSPDLNPASSSMPPNCVMALNENAVVSQPKQSRSLVKPAPESCCSPNLNPASSSMPPNRVVAPNKNAVVHLVLLTRNGPKHGTELVKKYSHIYTPNSSTFEEIYDASERYDINHDDMVNQKYQKELQPGNIVIVTFNNSARLEGRRIVGISFVCDGEDHKLGCSEAWLFIQEDLNAALPRSRPSHDDTVTVDLQLAWFQTVC
ncbi:uncharacterized protein EI90DRAFT_3017578 [Cantharellus anzutake]|uniref:uncharacterized protein n=1 Tax=Cantharellus anzutake TaxID=1750568 RepID=UPI001906B439|nr:uncharacterized protein EI90DRAFT_3017578 [Cantharellus anzutake]KAF8328730.1 hypothetical protein EI90DRAFT_3017578 [Cantharellus anzutake]